jgi:hypothetical protein
MTLTQQIPSHLGDLLQLVQFNTSKYLFKFPKGANL